MKLAHVLAASTLVCSGAALCGTASASASTPSQALPFCRDLAAAREATPLTLPSRADKVQVHGYLEEITSLATQLRSAASSASSKETAAKLETAIGKSSIVATFGHALLVVLGGPPSATNRTRVTADRKTLDAAIAAFTTAYQSATVITSACHGYSVVAGLAESIAAATMSSKTPNRDVKSAIRRFPRTDKITATAVGKRWTVTSGLYVGYDVCLTVPESSLGATPSVLYGTC